MPDPLPANPQLQQHLDAVTHMRQQGATWDEIGQYYSAQTDRMRKGGASEDEIRAYYGGADPAPVQQGIDERTAQNAPHNPPSLVDAFVGGLTGSSTAALLGMKPTNPDQPGEGMAAAITHAVGETIGDLPVAIPSAFWAGKKVTAALTAVPGVGETPVPEIAGGLAGGFTAAAGPTLIKAERDAWMQAHGQGWNAADFLQGHGMSVNAAIQAGQQGAVGAATGGAGGIAERTLARAGVTGLAATAGKLGTEAATYTAAEGAIRGQMPTTQDLVDGAVLLAAFHAGGKGVSAAMSGYRARLSQHYVETGQNPLEAAQAAKTDPVLRRELLGQPAANAPPGSVRTPTSPAHTDQYVIPRVRGDFDTSVNFTLQHEGGAYVIDANNAGVKWGINQADHPGVDVKNLSRDQAAEIYRVKYWDAVGADRLPPNMRAAAFDTAVVEGVSRAKTWLAESGNDPQVFLGKRAAFEAELARRDPGKYGRFVKAWANRLRDLGHGGSGPDIVGRDPNAAGELTPAEQEILNREGQPPEPPEKPPAEEPFEPGDGGALDRVMSRTAPPKEEDRWGDTIEGAKRIYGEMFNPDHPIRSMMDAVTDGKPIDDAANPEYLRRLAENSAGLSKYAIEHKMVDLDGNVTGPGLKEIITGAGDKAAQRTFLDGYARARWAQMMHEQGLNPSDISKEDADAVVAKLGSKHEARFKQLVEWRNGTLKWLADGDVHDKARVEKMIETNEASMPGYRRMDDGTMKPVVAPGKGMWSPIKAAKGSERLVEPLETSLMRDAFLRRSLAENNRANVALADAGMEGNKASQARKVDFNVISAMDELKDRGIEDDDLLSQLARATSKSVDKDEVPILRNGKLYGVTFENPEITRVLRGYDQGARSTAVKLVAAITAIPRTMQTIANPFFGPKMQIYDAWFQHITNPDARNVAKSFTMGLGAMLDKSSGDYDAWMRSGGAERVFVRMSNDEYLKQQFGLRNQDDGLMGGAWNAVQTGMHALDAWARLTSTPIRLGRYVQGVKAGESDIRAAVASTESSLHRPAFGGPLSKVLNSVIPFLTARLNGMEKTARAAVGGALPMLSGGRISNDTQTGVPYSARKFWINGAVAISLPALMTWWAFKDQEWYKGMPDWQKDNAIFVVPPLTKGGGPIPIPGPPLVSTIFSGLPRRLMEAFFEDNPAAFKDFMPSVGAGLLGPAEFMGASILQPVLEHVSNFSFFKNQNLVSPDTLKGVQPAEQFNHYSSDVARSVSRFVNDIPLLRDVLGKPSPVVVDNYIHYWGGQPGQAAVQTVQAIDNNFRTNPRPAGHFSDLPGVSSWMTRYPSASAQPITDFYNRVDELNQVHGSILAAARDGDLKRVQELANQNPSFAAYHAARFQNEPSTVDMSPYLDALGQAAQKADWPDVSLIREGERAIKQANQYAQKVWESPQLNAQDKRQILDQTYSIMQVMAERTNEAMDRAQSGRTSRAAPAAPGAIQFIPPDQRVQ